MAKKWANGEDNIRKRKDGRWEGRYTAGYDEKTGKRLIKNVLGKTNVADNIVGRVLHNSKPGDGIGSCQKSCGKSFQKALQTNGQISFL